MLDECMVKLFFCSSKKESGKNIEKFFGFNLAKEVEVLLSVS